MICELCGKTDMGGFRVRLEGTVISACRDCSKSKEIVSDLSKKPDKPKNVKKPEYNVELDVSGSFELVDEWGVAVRKAREKKGWSQDDLGMQINESHSVIHRIELGKYEPTDEVARKLERKLGVTLLEKTKTVGDIASTSENKEFTLGDMIVIRKRK